MTARVLVVDDVLPNVKLLEQRLNQEYFDVLTATSGTDALELVSREKPDVVLLDVMMPGMDGFEVCRRIKGNDKTSHIPIVLVTALDQPEDKAKGLDAGADDFLTKPVKEVALYARVRSLARLKFMMDELRNRDVTSTMMGMPGLEQDLDVITDARILLVSDKEDTHKDISETLQQLGDTICVPGDDAAVEKARDGNFDVILVDLDLADADGLRIASRIRSLSETRNLAILVLTAPEDTYRIVKALDIGCNDYVSRPFDKLELVARVKTQLKRKRFADRLRENLHMSVRLATTDAVTGLYNRHYMSSHLKTMAEQAKANRKPLSVALLDLDHFKNVNDTHGHAAGDEVLAEFARRVSTSIRGVDLAARYGGEEFVVIMPDCDDQIALEIGERLRGVAADTPFTIADGKKKIDVTVSIGVATTVDHDIPPNILLERADEALYIAKGNGRNRVILAQEEEKAVVNG